MVPGTPISRLVSNTFFMRSSLIHTCLSPDPEVPTLLYIGRGGRVTMKAVELVWHIHSLATDHSYFVDGWGWMCHKASWLLWYLLLFVTLVCMPPKFWLKYHTFFVMRPIKLMTVLLLLPNTYMYLANDANWKLNYEEAALSFFCHLCGSHDCHQTMGHVHS